MFNIDLMNIFEGLVRNYLRLNLTTEDDRIEVLKKELNYISSAGQILGYSSIIKGINNESRVLTDTIEIEWRNYDDKRAIPDDLFLYYSQEIDLFKDINAINNLVNKINYEVTAKGFIQVIEISSKERLNYLNKMLKESKRFKDVDVLIIYKVSNIKEKSSNYYSYLFEEGILIKEKNANSYYDKFGFLKMKFV